MIVVVNVFLRLFLCVCVCVCVCVVCVVFFQAEDGIRDLVRSRGLGDVYKRQLEWPACRNKNALTASVHSPIPDIHEFGQESSCSN